ncbi:LysR substrate-binding domain-containing protein [Phaeobacter sp. J2-8]|uniref:LysR substrate-binding domain-containing protein n=1 Tax=Phaeobacter sp. J2-8 TaxID=2931394 RepID=UPI001FD07D76|nr:LysR substrate-binding domain-containing protein [Phaeobacter sp. J2-8]MCJ7874478.1 LysR substrate-binding domain-containing protein [Phaeobacter sp. J2-8]
MKTPISHFRLRHLRLVHAIAETGQISLAAQRLAITQPAASRTLSEVERLVGEPLFDRHSKGMRLTLIGEVVASHASTVVGDLEGIAQEVEAYRRGRAGVVRIGAVTGAAVGVVVPAVQNLKRTAKSATVSIDVAPSVDLMERLLRGDLDVVLCRMSRDMDSQLLQVRPGRVEELGYLVRAGHPLADRTGLGLGELAEFSWVIQGRGMPIREAVEQAFLNGGLAMPKDIVDTASLLVALACLHDSDAVAAVSKEVLNLLDTGGGGRWATLNMKESLVLSPYQLVRKRDRPITPICQRLVDLLEVELANRG